MIHRSPRMFVVGGIALQLVRRWLNDSALSEGAKNSQALAGLIAWIPLVVSNRIMGYHSTQCSEGTRSPSVSSESNRVLQAGANRNACYRDNQRAQRNECTQTRV
jgi:hypothetical protein